MFYPTLNYVSKNREMVNVFRGLNNTYSCSAGEWVKEHGLTSRCFPAFSPERVGEKVIPFDGMEGFSQSSATYMTANGIILSICEGSVFARNSKNGVEGEIPAELIDEGTQLPLTVFKRAFFCEMGNKALIYLLDNPDIFDSQGYNNQAIWIDKIILESALSGEIEPEEGIAKGTTWGDIEGTPELDFIFEHKNRLWGCRYGRQYTLTDGGEARFPFVNEIYASALGSYEEWRTYDGISTDSYAASVGTGAAFTGAIAFNDDPIFFKEDRIYRISGDYPAQFVITETECEGVARKGGWNTLAVLNGILYYLSKNGIYAYTGGIPERISDAFGYDAKLFGYAAHAFKNKYYISCFSSHGGHLIATFDVEKGIWHTSEYDSPAHSIFGRSEDSITADFGSRWQDIDTPYGEYRTDWYAESGDLGLSYPDGKYVSKIKIRAELEEDARVDVEIKYDGDGEWRREGTLCGTPEGKFKTFAIANMPRRCDTYRLRLSGSGKCVILSITNNIEQGGE